MKQDERDYLLRIINVQDGMLQAHAQHNMSKLVMLQKELESMQKASFAEVMASIKEQKREVVKKIDEKFVEIEKLIKELKNI